MRCVLVLALLIFSLKGMSYTPFYSQPNRVGMVINPANVGTNGGWGSNLHYRNQWPLFMEGTELDVQTYLIGVQYGFSKYIKGLGVHAQNYRIGFETTSDITIPVSKDFQISNNTVISFGIGLSWKQVSINKSLMNFAVNDPALQSSFKTAAFFDLSSGIVLKSGKLNTGFSIFHLNNPNNSTSINAVSRLRKDYMLYANYDIQVKQIVLTPAVFSTFNSRDFLFEGGLTTSYKKVRLYTGYRQNATAILGFGVNVFGMDIGYSIDLSFDSLYFTDTGGSHEIGIQYLFGKEKKGEYNKSFL